MGTISACLLCLVTFCVDFLSTKHQVNIIHFCVSLLILDWTLSTLNFDGSFVDQYIESFDIEQMIVFLFDPQILLFVIFSSIYLFKISPVHVSANIEVVTNANLCAKVFMPISYDLARCTITLVYIKMVVIASLLPTVRSFILLLEFLQLKNFLIKTCMLFAFKQFHCFCILFEILINIHYLFTYPSTILIYRILKYKNCSIVFYLDHAKCLE